MRIDSENELRRVMKDCRVIAVVGLSPKPDRPSHHVAEYLIDNGYTVIPVNPGQKEILGQTCYPDLASIPGKIDMVDVFRNSDDVPPIADETIRLGAKCLWLQIGVIHEAAAQKASDAGLDVVMDRCVKIEHATLLG